MLLYVKPLKERSQNETLTSKAKAMGLFDKSRFTNLLLKYYEKD